MSVKRPYARPRLEKRDRLQTVTADILISAPLADS